MRVTIRKIENILRSDEITFIYIEDILNAKKCRLACARHIFRVVGTEIARDTSAGLTVTDGFRVTWYDVRVYYDCFTFLKRSGREESNDDVSSRLNYKL